MIRTIIIDDESPARDLIRHYLKAHTEIEVLGEFQDGFEGARAIRELKPDLVFLDIQMPKLTGFEMLELVEDPPVIIFSTAYDQYALQAFEIHAADYLLKPYSADRFASAVKKAVERVGERGTAPSPVPAILHTVDESTEILQRIAVKNRHKIDVIPVSDILYIEAEDDYVMIHTATSKFLKEKTMKFMESHLDPARFIRIHRSFIVNADYIQRLEIYEKESYAVMLKNGKSLKASTSGYRLLKERLHL